MANTNIVAEEAMQKFVDRLVQQKGLGELGAEVVDQIKQDLLDRIEDRVNAAVLEKLPPERLGEFETLLDRNASDEELQSFCKQYVPDFDEAIAAALLRFQQVYLNG